MKLSNEDYKGADAQKALDDFLERVHAYEKVRMPMPMRRYACACL